MQTRRMSWVEATTNTVVGFLVALATQYAVFPLAGIELDAGGHVLVAVPFVLTSILRGFLLRRFFNWVDSRCGR